MGGRGLFSAETWIAWLAATLVAAVTLCGFVFANFETKADAIDKRDQTKADALDNRNQLEKRLDRIEGKVDETLRLMKHSAR